MGHHRDNNNNKVEDDEIQPFLFCDETSIQNGDSNTCTVSSRSLEIGTPVANHEEHTTERDICRRLFILLPLFVLGWYCHAMFLANSSKTSAIFNSRVPPEVEESIIPASPFSTKSPTSEDFEESDTNTALQEDVPSHILRSYTYSNCPFTMAKFSQYELASEGPFQSDMDRFINSIDRAKMGLDLSNSMHAYERVVNALENQAFDNRKIVLDGDSLTRQFFISLSCLAWSAGYVEHFEYPQEHHTFPGSINPIMNNAHYTASSKFFGQGFIRLKGGGEVYYISNPTHEKIESITQRMIHDACDDNSELKKQQFRARFNYDINDFVPLGKRDVLVLAAGHHEERSKYTSAYAKMYQCIKQSNSKKDFKKWPFMMYQLSSVESFWTDSGMHSGQWMSQADRMTCQEHIKSAPHREEERQILHGLVSFIGDTIDVENMGHLHVWHGDCLHWLQPGIPDLYAAELADFLLSTMT